MRTTSAGGVAEVVSLESGSGGGVEPDSSLGSASSPSYASVMSGEGGLKHNPSATSAYPHRL